MTKPNYSPATHGFFGLRTAADLLKKLQAERDRIVGNPQDYFTLYNFFVTAFHMAEWAGMKELQKTEPLLQICGHLANGAKHFQLNDGRHRHVHDTKDLSYAEPGYFAEDYIEPVSLLSSPPMATYQMV